MMTELVTSYLATDKGQKLLEEAAQSTLVLDVEPGDCELSYSLHDD